MELRTSEQWFAKHVREWDFTVILDPDGWDRSNLRYSFYEEEITEEEYYRRRARSTTSSSNKNRKPHGEHND